MTAELGHLFERSPVEEPNAAMLPLDEPLVSEFLKCPVHMNYRQSACIGNVLLCKGEIEAAIVEQTDEGPRYHVPRDWFLTSRS